METINNTLTDYFKSSYDDLTKNQKNELTKFIETNENICLYIHEDDSSSNLIKLKCYINQEEFKNELQKVEKSFKKIVFIKLKSKKDEDNEIINEEEIINKLKYACENESFVLNILNELKKYSKFENIQTRIKNEREKVIEKILSWANSIIDFNELNENDYIKKMSILDINKSKIISVINLSKDLFIDLDDYNKLRKELEQIKKELTDECNFIFKQWCDYFSSIEFNLNKQCIEFDSETQIPFVTYDQRLYEYINDCRFLNSIGYKLSNDLVQINQNAFNYAEIANELGKIINFYCTIGDQILISQRPMLIEPAKRFTALLESKDTISWSQDENELRKWLNNLKKACKNFENENRNLRKHHQQILDLMIKLFDLSFDNWSLTLNKINLILLEIDNKYSNSYGWFKHWNIQLYKVLNLNFKKSILNCNKWLGLLDEKDKNLFFNDKKFKVDLIFNSNQVQFRPSIEQLREKLYKKIYKFIAIPYEFKGLVTNKNNLKDASIERLFLNILIENKDLFHKLYEQAEKILNELKIISEQFIEWTDLYNVVKICSQETMKTNPTQNNNKSNFNNQVLNKSDQISYNNIQTSKNNHQVSANDQVASSINQVSYNNNQVNYNNQIINDEEIDNEDQFLKFNTLESFESNLILLKTKSQEFNEKYFNNEIYCVNSNIIINLSPIKVFVDWVYLEMNKIIIKLLSRKLETEFNVIKEKLNDLILKFTQQPKTIEELKEFENLISIDLNFNILNIHKQFEEYEKKKSFLNKWSKDNSTDDDLNFLIKKLNIFVKDKERYFNEFRNYFKNNFDSRSKKLLINLIKFKKSWNEEVTKEVEEEYLILEKEFEQIKQISLYFDLKIQNDLKEKENILTEFSQVFGKLKILSSLDLLLEQYYDLEWISVRNKLNLITNIINEWCENNKNLLDNFVMNKIEELKNTIHLLKLCKGEYYVKTHWEELFRLLNLNKNNKLIEIENLKFSQLLNKKEFLQSKKTEIKLLNDKAYSELSIRESFNELDTFTELTKFEFFVYKLNNGKEINLIKNWHQILSKTNECLIIINSIKNLKQLNNDELIEKSSNYEKKLFSLNNSINLLNNIQRKWIYLEPIYTNTNLIENNFNYYSNIFLDLLNQINQDIHVIKLIKINLIDKKLIEIHDGLKLCEKNLKTFLEGSRNRFSKFYFLSDQDLLVILAGKTDLNSSGLLRKIFNNCVNKLILNENNEIYAIESLEGEIINLEIKIKNIINQDVFSIEKWLFNIDQTISISIKKQLKNILDNNLSVFNLIQSSYCLQIILLKNWIDFTEKTELSIYNNSFNNQKLELEKNLSFLTSFENDKVLTNVEQIKLKSLIFDTIYFLSVLDFLEKSNEKIDSNHFLWKKHIRYYIIDKNELKISVCMGLSEINYSFEYLGCFNKLVQTSLTDKCFLVCMQALSFGLGGNPYGPAGTGKTETIKSLGQYLGRQVLVFNCDENVDFKSMTRILIGLVKCGFWGCFDEFNRLQLNVLSALSTYIESIQNVLKKKDNSSNVIIKLSDNEVLNFKCNFNSSIFVTLNPASKQYKSRNRLPENLKSLFLPIAMQVPEVQLISTIFLLAEGFDLKISQNLGFKINIFFELAIKSLSKQIHYDWGLRAIKSCLISAGRLLKLIKNQQVCDTNKQIEILILSINSQIKPKLVLEDRLVYENLICDVFGKNFMNLKNIFIESEELKKYIEEAYKNLDLILNEEQVTKVIELNEQVNTRLGIALIGESFVGKTTIWKLFIESLNIMSRQKKENIIYKFITINPKAFDRNQLLGYLDNESNEWIDGLLSLKIRDLISYQDLNERIKYFIIFDGEIDPNWVESLNSVLDDNQVLTLPTGERLNFDSEKFSIIFETTSLKFCSPATISRLGIVSVTENKSDLFLKKKLNKFLSKTEFDEAYETIKKNNEKNNLNDYKLIISFIRYSKNENFLNLNFNQLITNNFLIQNNYQKLFEDNFDLIYVKSRCKVIVYSKILFDLNQHFILYGSKSSGKNKIFKIIGSLKKNFCLYIHCVPKLSSIEILNFLKKKCTLVDQGSKKILKSPLGNKLIIFIKNLHNLDFDEWNCKKVISFFTGLLTYKGCFDPINGDWIEFENFQIICTSHSLENISNRFLNLFSFIKIDYPSEEELKIILRNIIKTKASFDIYKDQFLNIFFMILENFISLNKDLNFSDLNLLVNGKKIINSLNRYENLNELSIIREIYYLYSNLFDDISERNLEKVFIKSFNNFENIFKCYLFCDQFDKKIIEQEFSENELNWLTIIDNWCIENNNQIKICITKEHLNLLSTLICFLTNKFNNKIKVMFLVGANGSSRKLFSTIVANYLSYDLIWCLDEYLNEKQLNHELRNIFGLSNKKLTNDEEMKKILIILEEFHFNLMPYLQKVLFNLVIEFNDSVKNNSKNKIFIKIIILNKKLKKNQWESISLIKKIKPLKEKNFIFFTIQLIEDQIKFEEQKKYLALDKINDEINLFEELALMMIKIKNVFKQEIENNLRIYYHFTETFCLIFNEKQNFLLDKSNRLSKGVQQLEHTSEQVELLKKQAINQEKQLIIKKQEAENALNMITNSMNSSEAHQIEIEDVRSKTQVETENIEKRKKIIDEQLSKIEPQLAAANQAVNSIKVDQLNEIRSLRAPPEIIRDILEAVLRLLGNLDTSWNAMKSFLGKRRVKEDLLNFNCRKVSKENLIKVQEILKSKPNSFTQAAAKRASAAALPLANWVFAVVAYTTVLQEIEPLENELKKLQSSLNIAETRINSLNTELKSVEEVVDDLKNKFNKITFEAAEIEVEFKKTSKTLDTSEKLFKQLESEYNRWSNQLKEIDSLNKKLVINSLISSVYITFCMSQNSLKDKEALLLKSCEALNVKSNINVDQILTFLDCSNDQEIILKFGGTYLAQMIIDPNNLFKEKLNLDENYFNKLNTFKSINSLNSAQSKRSLYKSSSISSLHSQTSQNKNFELIDFQRNDFSKLIELSIRFGKTIILNGFYDLNENYFYNQLIMFNLLKKNLFGSNETRQWIKLGNKKVDYNLNFKFFILKNYMPSLEDIYSNYFTIINLMPDEADTEKKFLSFIIKNRNPKLEEQKLSLEEEQKKIKLNLKNLEDELLIKLNNSGRDILNNKDLIESLKSTKEVSNEISLSLIKLKELSEKLENERNQFKSYAKFTSVIYFKLKQLKNINLTYNFGLEEFEQLFDFFLKKNFNLNELELLSFFYNYYSNALNSIDQKVFFKYLINDNQQQTLKAEGTLTLTNYIQKQLKCQPYRPILIFTDPGIDPLNEINQTILKLKIQKVDFISLNLDCLNETTIKFKLIEEQNDSSVLCISNIHLFTNWFSTLTKVCSNFYLNQKNKEDKTIKLILLISETKTNLPIDLLEICSKFTYQSTSNLQAQFDDFIDKLNNSDSIYIKFIYFHITCNERKNYVPIGWSKNYEIGYNDFQIGLKLLNLARQSLKKNNSFYEKLMISFYLNEIAYGSKLNSILDKNILNSLLKKWILNENLIKNYSYLSEMNEEKKYEFLGLPTNINKWKLIMFEKKIKQKLLLLNNQLNYLSKNTDSHDLIKLIEKLNFEKFCIKLKSYNLNFNEKGPIQDFIIKQKHKIETLFELVINTLKKPVEEIFDKLLKNKTPEIWFTFWEFGSKEADLFINQLYKLGNSFLNKNTSINSEFDLNSFLDPDAFLITIKQQASRYLNLTIDEIEMHIVTNDLNIVDHNNLYKFKLKGLNLVGAQLQDNLLKKVNFNSEFTFNLIEINVFYISKSFNLKNINKKAIPIFGNNKREILIDFLSFECKNNTEDIWSLNSVALIVDY